MGKARLHGDWLVRHCAQDAFAVCGQMRKKHHAPGGSALLRLVRQRERHAFLHPVRHGFADLRLLEVDNDLRTRDGRSATDENAKRE